MSFFSTPAAVGTPERKAIDAANGGDPQVRNANAAALDAVTSAYDKRRTMGTSGANALSAGGVQRTMGSANI